MMSYCDILFTLTVVCSPFFGTQRDQFYFQKPSGSIAEATSPVSCRIMGTLLQLSLSNILYFGMLSFYFLLTIRFHVSHDQFSKKYEPYMHAFCILWPLITATIGFVVDWYDSLQSFPGCWIDNYPKGAPGPEAKASEIAWICSGSVTSGTILSLLVNYCVISWYVTRQYGSRNNNSTRLYDNSTAPFGPQQESQILQQPVSRRQQLSNMVASSIRRLSFDDIEVVDNSGNSVFEDTVRTAGSNSNDVLTARHFHQQQPTTTFSGTLRTTGQNHRVRLVSTQAYLYVFSFFLTYTWFIALQIIESIGLIRELPIVYYMIFLQAIFSPLAGLWNALIYFRPMYIQFRRRQGASTRWQSIKYVVFGIQESTSNNNDTNNTSSDQETIPHLLSPIMNGLRRFIMSFNIASNGASSSCESKPISSSGGDSGSGQQQSRSIAPSVVDDANTSLSAGHNNSQITESIPDHSTCSSSLPLSNADQPPAASNRSNYVDSQVLCISFDQTDGSLSTHSSLANVLDNFLNHQGGEDDTIHV